MQNSSFKLRIMQLILYDKIIKNNHEKVNVWIKDSLNKNEINSEDFIIRQ